MDVKKLLKSLNEHKVRFVIIGATAGRPKDIEDLRYLEEIKRQLAEKNRG